MIKQTATSTNLKTGLHEYAMADNCYKPGVTTGTKPALNVMLKQRLTLVFLLHSLYYLLTSCFPSSAVTNADQ